MTRSPRFDGCAASRGEEPERRVVIFPTGESGHPPLPPPSQLARRGSTCRRPAAGSGYGRSRVPGAWLMDEVIRVHRPPRRRRRCSVRARARLRVRRSVATEGTLRGLIGPHGCRGCGSGTCSTVGVASVLPAGARYGCGSGAGLPGIVLALARPDTTVTLLEPMARRVTSCSVAASGSAVYGRGPDSRVARSGSRIAAARRPVP